MEEEARKYLDDLEERIEKAREERTREHEKRFDRIDKTVIRIESKVDESIVAVNKVLRRYSFQRGAMWAFTTIGVVIAWVAGVFSKIGGEVKGWIDG